MIGIKVNINGKELILPEENKGMIEYRGLTYEVVEVESVPNIMEDLIAELQNQ